MSKPTNYESCKTCDWKKKYGKCPFDSRLDCSNVLVEIACKALKDEEAVQCIPIDLIAEAARAQGYSGELRKVTIKII